MPLISLNKLVLLAISVVAYSAYAGLVKLEHQRRASQFALDQRRKAGIPDTDTRPFGIARADALSKRQRRAKDASLGPAAPPFRPTGVAHAASAPSPRPFARASPTKPTFDSGLAQPGYLRHRQSGFPTPSEAEREPSWPGAFHDFSPSQHRLYPNVGLHTPTSPLEEKAIVWSSPPTRKHGLSDTDSLAGSNAAGTSNRKSQKVDRENLERRAVAVRTSKKRRPSEVRDGGDEDSVAGDRVVKRRNKVPLQELYDASSLEAASYDDMDEADDDLDPSEQGDEEMHRATPASALGGRRGTKRDVDEVDGEESTAGASARVTRSRKRGKAQRSLLAEELVSSEQDLEPEYQLEDEEMASLSDFGADRIETDRESLGGRRSVPRSLKGKGKRKVDTSDDREPGDEWTDLNGLRWKVDEQGVRRRATVVVEMRPKYNMPKDSQHPDAKQKIQVYVERFLSEEEYEEAKRNKLLGFQEAERQREAEARLKAAEEAAAKAAAEAAAGRNVSTPKKLRNNDLLYSDSVTRHQSPLRISRSELSLKRSIDTPPRQASTPLRESTPSSASKVSPSKRISLSASNSAGTSRTGSPAVARLTPNRRGGLDEESKRRREEALLKKLREEKEAKEAATSSKATAVQPTNAATPPIASTPASLAITANPAAAGDANPTATSSSTASPFPGLASATTAKQTTSPDKKVTFDLPAATTSPQTKPGDASAGKTDSPSFSFGAPPASSAPSSTAKDAEAKPAASETKPSFTFGVPPATSAKPPVSDVKPSFSFGTPPAPAAAASSAPDKPKGLSSFSFGAPAGSTAAGTTDDKKSLTSTGGFSFGAPSSQPKKEASAPSASTSGFTFGGGSTPSSQTAVVPASAPASTAASAPVFSFGAPKTDAKADSTPSSSFTFGAPKPDAKAGPTPSSSFTFGASSSGGASPASPFTAGSPATTTTATANTPSFTFGAPATKSATATGQAGLPPKPSFTFGSTQTPGDGKTSGAPKFTFGS